MLFPIIMHKVSESDSIRYKAATSLDAMNDNFEQLDSRLKLIEMLYDVTVTAASRALMLTGKNKNNDFRAFWLAADCIERFTRQLATAGFFCPVKMSLSPATWAFPKGIYG